MKTESMITFEEYREPGGKEVIAALLERPDGRQVVIGYLDISYDGKHKVYVGTDTAGKQLYPPNFSKQFAKEQFTRQEQYFIDKAQWSEHVFSKSDETFDQLVAELHAEQGRKSRSSKLKNIRARKQQKAPALTR